MALLAPVALAAAARWPAFAAATRTLAALVALPMLGFGPEIWLEFSGAPQRAVEGGQNTGQMQSLTATLRLGGVGDLAALALQAAPALAMTGVPAGLIASGLALHLVLRRCASASD